MIAYSIACAIYKEEKAQSFTLSEMLYCEMDFGCNMDRIL